MEDELANLNLADEEKDPIQGQEDDEETEEDFSLHIVGKVLTDSAVHFSSIRNVLAELWHLIERVEYLVENPTKKGSTNHPNNISRGKGVMGELSRRFHKVSQVRDESRFGELEDRPIDLVDGKKRQKVQHLEDSNNNYLMNTELDNDISMAASKQDGRL
ncbi:hypothetical protein GOBAR_AA17373 [Gossypium barbadense]|uniref:Uncharacterized protein n=1 Tax=Gossypium barbadense TaxID=3634 RepID=A0A2P5XIX5_GOSBA|nr:hypothetical protein GOBAR_AA17373 [Gossypium barbadense]